MSSLASARLRQLRGTYQIKMVDRHYFSRRTAFYLAVLLLSAIDGSLLVTLRRSLRQRLLRARLSRTLLLELFRRSCAGRVFARDTPDRFNEQAHRPSFPINLMKGDFPVL